MKSRSDRVDRLIREIQEERRGEEEALRKRSTRGDLSRLVREYFRPHWKRIAFSYAAICLWSALPYAFSLTWRFLFDRVLVVGAGPAAADLQRRFHLLWVYLWLNAGIWTVHDVLNWLFHWVSVGTGLELVYTFRKQLHEKLQALHIGFYERNPTGRIMSRIMDDVEVIRGMLTKHLVTLAISVVRIIVGLAVIFYINWKIAALIAVSLPIYAWTFALLRAKVRRANIALRHLNARMYALSTERIANVHVVASFTRERGEVRSFARLIHDNARLCLRTVLYNGSLSVIAAVISGTVTVAIFYWGALQIRDGALSLGDVLALVSASGVMFGPVNQLITLMSQFQVLLIVIGRVFRLLDEKEEVVPGSVILRGMKGKIAFDRVTFSYQNQKEPALDDLSLDISPGEKVALMGPSGSGKSTLFHLLMRFYDPQKGEVRVGGVNLRDAHPGSVRRHVCMVQQEATIFSGTVADNIAYGVLDATPAQVMKAAQQAELHELIMSLPAKYETEVGENGITLSGGQKQRLALATALLTDPQILLLDDTTSALDVETEIRIRKTLNRILKGRTSIISTHRIATARDCGRIIVLDHGRIVQHGTHSELLDQPGFYRRSALQQGWVLPEIAETDSDF